MTKEQLDQLQAMRDTFSFTLRNIEAVETIMRNMARTGISLDWQHENNTHHVKMQLLRIMSDMRQELQKDYDIDWPQEGAIEQNVKAQSHG